MSIIVKFRVTSIPEYKPLPGATFKITSPGGVVVSGTMGQDTGACFLATETPQNYRIEVQAEGYVSIDRLVKIPDGGWIILTAQISKNPDWSGSMSIIRTAKQPCTPGDAGQPGPTPVPTPGDQGPQLQDCTFPTLSWNLISVLSALIEWIGCILHNIITILLWYIDWLLHFPDHLDAWISRLFGVDPAGPFFDQVMHNIDVWISNRLGVDPDKPLLEELINKVFAYFTGWLSTLVDDDLKNPGRKI